MKALWDRMQPFLFLLSLVASILLSVQEFQTRGYPVTASGVNTCRTGCKYVVQGQDTNTLNIYHFLKYSFHPLQLICSYQNTPYISPCVPYIPNFVWNILQDCGINYLQKQLILKFSLPSSNGSLAPSYWTSLLLLIRWAVLNSNSTFIHNLFSFDQIICNPSNPIFFKTQ